MKQGMSISLWKLQKLFGEPMPMKVGVRQGLLSIARVKQKVKTLLEIDLLIYSISDKNVHISFDPIISLLRNNSKCGKSYVQDISTAVLSVVWGLRVILNSTIDN